MQTERIPRYIMSTVKIDCFFMLSFKSKMVDCNETASSLCFHCSYRGRHKHLKVAHFNESCAFFFLAHSVTYNIDNWLRLFKVDFFFFYSSCVQTNISVFICNKITEFHSNLSDGIQKIKGKLCDTTVSLIDIQGLCHIQTPPDLPQRRV